MLAGHAAIGRPVRELSTLFIMVTRSCLNSSGIIKEIFSFPLNFFMKWFPDHLWALISGRIWATSFIDPISFCTCFSSTGLFPRASLHLVITLSAFSLARNQVMDELLNPTPSTVPLVTNSKAFSASGQFCASGMCVFSQNSLISVENFLTNSESFFPHKVSHPEL